MADWSRLIASTPTAHVMTDAAAHDAGDLLNMHARRLIASITGSHRIKRLARLAGVSARTAEDWVYRGRRPSAAAALSLLLSDPTELAAFQGDMTVLSRARDAARRARERQHAAGGSTDRNTGVVAGFGRGSGDDQARALVGSADDTGVQPGRPAVVSEVVNGV